MKLIKAAFVHEKEQNGSARFCIFTAAKIRIGRISFIEKFDWLSMLTSETDFKCVCSVF
jgi:hypothetical protein